MSPATRELQRVSLSLADGVLATVATTSPDDLDDDGYPCDCPEDDCWCHSVEPPCAVCDGTGVIERQQRDAAGNPYRAPWLTETVSCPDCEGRLS